MKISLMALIITGLVLSFSSSESFAQKKKYKKAAVRSLSSISKPKYIHGQGQKMLETEKSANPNFLKKDLRPKNKDVEVHWYRVDWTAQKYGAPERSPGAGLLILGGSK